MKKIGLIVSAILVLSSCVKDKVLSGPQVTEERTVSNFNDLVLDSDANVILTSDPAYIIKIEAPENLMSFITTEVSNGTLVISEDKNHVMHRKEVTIMINKSNLDAIRLNGSGDISADNLNSTDLLLNLNGSGDLSMNVTSNTIKVELNGSGDVDLDGSTSALDLDLNGSGNLDTRNLNASNAIVELDGSGNISATATTSIDIELSGSGDVFYWGNPTIIMQSNSGSGSINNMN